MKDRILDLVKNSKWTLIKDQDDIKMMQFQSGANKMNVYWSTMSVAVLKRGVEPQYIKDVDLEKIAELFSIKQNKSFIQKIKEALGWKN